MIVTAEGCTRYLTGRGQGYSKHPIMQRTAPTTKSYIAPNLQGGAVEKLCDGVARTEKESSNSHILFAKVKWIFETTKQ